MEEIAKYLESFGISPTPVRMLVYDCLKKRNKPMSLSDLEVELESVDKSTISRTLATFRGHHLVHTFSDGSGKMKYELCLSPEKDKEEDTHVHFRCEKCGETFCMTTISIPEVQLPAGFVMHECNYIITGICPDCRR